MEKLSFLGRRLSPRFQMRLVTIPGGATRPYDPAEWADAIIVVEEGEVEIECDQGGSRRFAAGAVLCLSGMPLRALHNRRDEAALLSAVSRRGPP